jgi:methionine-gamma-lyase
MDEQNKMGFDTLCVHAGHKGENNRAHLTPIYASSTYTFDSAEQAIALFKGEENGYVYSRFGNPTITEAENKIAEMEAFGLKNEDGTPLALKAILHASGMAAITTLLLSNLKAGDKIITHFSLYGGMQEMVDKILPGLGIEAVILDFRDAESVVSAIERDRSIKMMYLETPANPTIICADIEMLTKQAHHYGLLVSVDNTFATPFLQQPFRYDVDFVVHSTTKFLNGHGTALGGVLIGRNLDKMNSIVTKTHRLLGGNSNAFEAFLLVNGMKTLGLRMERHCNNAIIIAQMLVQNPGVDRVNYLGLPDHPDYEIARKQMKHPGAMMSFELKGGMHAGIRFLNRLKLCTHAVSLGTCDTLVAHPASTTAVGVPREKRIQFGITDGLIRFSTGIENVEDILRDLEQAIG